MTRTIATDLLALKLGEAANAPIAELTRRDIRLPAIQGKALAVIGVRRGGKTSFLQRCMAERLENGLPRQSQLLIGLEDERHIGMTAADLGWMFEEHERQNPGLRESGVLTIYLDEVQLVKGWETLVRRLIDSGNMEIFVSGSSAKLLSREVATSLRGRGMEVLVHPFSFRETLRHSGEEPDREWHRLSPGERAALDSRLRGYLEVGGFPEAQGTEQRDRIIALLKGYVDIMVLRDVIERHDVSNMQSVRWLQRHLLSTPGGGFSIRKLHDSLRSQGVAVGKDTLYDYLDHLEDAFLIRTVSMHSTSERQRMANPRKAYPIDTGLIRLYERSQRENRGRALETAVLLELERREYGVEYLRTSEGWEVDFIAERTGEPPLLIQVSLETQASQTWEREVRSLESALHRFPDASAFLITLDPTPPRHDLPESIRWMPATRWFLEREE